MKARRIERRGSRTAGYTCFSRACAVKEKDRRFRGPDSMAKVFLPLPAKVLLSLGFLRKWTMRTMFPNGIYEYVMARTRLFDKVFADALNGGFAQIVLLGSGMDTRALRFHDRNIGTTIFDLDIHATQRYKLKVLDRKRIPLPAALVFAPIDFSRQSLAEVLSRAGYRENQKTLFLWEGVTMYLEARAVDGTLAFIRGSAAQGSMLAFDYVYASVIRRENRLYGEQGIYDTVARTGEAWTFGIEDGAIKDFLADRGFSLLSHHAPADLEAACLTADDGTRFGRINGTHCIAIAGI